MASGRQVRALRGVVTASAATFVALLSHLLGGGDMPGWVGVVLPLALALPAGVALSARRLSVWRLSASVVVSQVLFHVLFVLGTPSSLGAVHGAHAHHAAAGPFPAALSGTPAVSVICPDGWMWAWHGVAALVTIALLHRGERILLRARELAGRIGAWVRRRLVVARVPLLRRPACLASAVWSTRGLSSLHELAPLRRRGPPVAAAV